ncbi:MAG: LysM peptidoglycan-binding domain-containing protein [Venatoribacter sp.]
MSKTLKSILLASLVGFAAHAAALDLKPDAPSQYIVKKGDTLWGISEKFTDNPWQWPEIWHQNNQIENPHLIFPGDEISLIKVDGEIRVTVTRRGEASRTVKLAPTARVEIVEAAIPTIPQDAIRGFVRYNQAVTKEQLDKAPYILSSHDERIRMGAGDKAYASGDFGDKGPAEMYGIYRKGQLFKDPKSKEVLGQEAIDVGIAKVVSFKDNIATLEITDSNQQIQAGDFLLSIEDREALTGYIPRAPLNPVNGTIIAVSGGVSQVGQYDMVTINRGQREGVEQGSVLMAKKAGVEVKDPKTKKKVQLPDEDAGTLLVIRSFEKMSYGLIMRATQPLRVGDKADSPDA